MDAKFIQKLQRFEQASVSFAVLSIQKNGSSEQRKAERIYAARKNQLYDYVESRGL